MEVKIGVQHAPRELTIDTTLDADEVIAEVDKVVESGGVLSLSDQRGRRVLVPAERLAYVEIASTSHGTVGFR